MSEIEKLRARAEKAEAALNAMRAEAALRPVLRKAGVADEMVKYALDAIRKDAKLEVDENGKLFAEWGGIPYVSAETLTRDFLKKAPFFARALGAEAAGAGLPANWKDLPPIEMMALGLDQLPQDAAGQYGAGALPPDWKDMSAGEMADLAFGGDKPNPKGDQSPQGMIARGLDKAGV